MITNPYSSYPLALEQATKVKLMIFDVDGVLTDGQIHLSDHGELFKSFNTQDGHGLKLLSKVGILTAIITGRNSAINAHRAAELDIGYLYQSCNNKLDAWQNLLQQTGLSAHECGYMGDDWPDLGVMSKVSFRACPIQAHHEIRTRSHFVTQNQGGYGAVREVCDLILQAQGHYASLLTQVHTT